MRLYHLLSRQSMQTIHSQGYQVMQVPAHTSKYIYIYISLNHSLLGGFNPLKIDETADI